MRLFLAVSIVGLHTVLTGQGVAADVALAVGPWRPFLRLILPMFFALSGYLVAGSLERCNTLGMFLGLRAIRIYPALMVEVVLSAFILGPRVTTLPLREYFADPLFSNYLLNALGDVHFNLPGIFATNPLPAIMNGQLWTIPFELYCYVTLAALTVLGVKRRRWIGPVGVVAVTLAYGAVTLYRHNGELVPVAGAINGALLVATFLAGVAIYQYRHSLPWAARFGAPALIGAGALLAYIPGGDFVAGPLAAYATVWLGLMNPSRRWLRGADYSYGIYLYGFAVQQTVVYMLPAARLWYVNLLVSLPLVVLIAAFSWHVVEKPANRLRPWLARLEARVARKDRPQENVP
jgi:peptidoglycan/LPS O-acetylase OafA/YrhL